MSVDVTLEQFIKEVPDASNLVKKDKGILAFPSVIKVEIDVGGKYGEGVLRIGVKTAGYYSAMAASIGFQLGAQVINLYNIS